MLKVTSFSKRVSKEGKEYLTLEITSDAVEMIQSQTTGRFYATVRKTSVTTTFGEEVANALIGSTMNGKIVRTECDPYEYTIQSTGEVVTLTHRWSYAPDSAVPQLQTSF